MQRFFYSSLSPLVALAPPIGIQINYQKAELDSSRSPGAQNLPEATGRIVRNSLVPARIYPSAGVLFRQDTGGKMALNTKKPVRSPRDKEI
jgi:hypothetical protein